MRLSIGADLPELSRVAVLGLARSGLASVEALLARGVEVVASDLRAEVPGLGVCDGLIPVLGSHPESLLRGVQLVVLSPGIPRTAPIVDSALARAIPVVSEIELASRLLPGVVVGITGTNGKSTTTALAAALLNDAEIEAVACGNLGTPWIAAAAAVADLPVPTRVWVVELSSFQLETVRRFAPDVAVHLNLTPDHLDRYRSLDDYGAAKARIFESQQEAQIAVLNADDPLVARIAPRARRFEFSRSRKTELGAWTDGDDVVADVAGSGPTRILGRGELSLPGTHNLENALAALAAVLPLGVSPQSAARTLRNFKGLRHRTELVRVRSGVAWYNDSKGTNVDATMKSLEGFPDSRVFLVLGGKDKGDDFGRLLPLAKRKVRRILAIGKAAGAVETALGGEVALSRAGTLEAAVAEAARDAARGDIVLLSPACASFDQFRDFEHRGDVFESLVLGLPGDSGEER
jgi:UDP-N-acetylmuramoylalanine--D-glutamate ligase